MRTWSVQPWGLAGPDPDGGAVGARLVPVVGPGEGPVHLREGADEPLPVGEEGPAARLCDLEKYGERAEYIF